MTEGAFAHDEWTWKGVIMDKGKGKEGAKKWLL